LLYSKEYENFAINHCWGWWSSLSLQGHAFP